jgi:hypothetical protein
MKNEKMKVEKMPWYKRIFAKEPTEEVYIKVIEMESQWIWSNKKDSFYASLYKIINPFTNEIKKVFAKTSEGNIYFDPIAYDKSGKLIQIK